VNYLIKFVRGILPFSLICHRLLAKSAMDGVLGGDFLCAWARMAGLFPADAGQTLSFGNPRRIAPFFLGSRVAPSV
jgi:hypothetical protein